jgi:UDP-N-acetylmuramate--alanine ligase
VRAAKPSRVIVAFQPHRYSRTRDLMEEFGVALAAADEVILADIYAASEDPIPGITVDALAAAVNARRSTPVRVVNSLDEVAPTLAAMAQRGDVLVTLGAGSIGGVASHVVHELERRKRREGVH